MADGHLNKCKECTKKDSADQYDEKVGDPKFKESERTRGRDKYRRLYSGTGKANPTANRNWVNRFPEKRLANQRAQKIKELGKENHHWSYMEAHWLDVIFLTPKEHGKAHRFISYDQERRMYRRIDTGELLDTRDRHEKFIMMCIKEKED